MKQLRDEKHITGENKVEKAAFRSLGGGSAPASWRRRWQQYGAREALLRMPATARTEKETGEPQQEKSGKDKGLSSP